MRYIQLSNDSYILYLSTGIKTITLRSFNFHKIKKLVLTEGVEDEVLPLLETPDLSEGLYEAYQVSSNEMLYLHTGTSGKQCLFNLVTDKEKCIDEETLKKLKPLFVGVYASLTDLMDDWPEYLL